MDIRYPFSLIYLKKENESVYAMPGYWFLYNMYALQRNSYKFKTRDKRKIILQNIETDYLAPDSVSEILSALKRIEFLTGKHFLGVEPLEDKKIIELGKKYLSDPESEEISLKDHEIMKKYGGIISKPLRGYRVYREMVIYFAVKNIIEYFNIDVNDNMDAVITKINALLEKKVFKKWRNVGGQIISEDDLNELKNDVKEKKINSWGEIHKRYEALWKKYPENKTRFGLYALSEILDKDLKSLKRGDWFDIFNDANKTSKKITINSYDSRKKDYSDPFRKMNYDNEEEMLAVMGPVENDFLMDLKNREESFDKIIARITAIG